MHVLIGDEMGIGKTAQAIVAAQALGASQVFVICPEKRRRWDCDIQGRGADRRNEFSTSAIKRILCP